VVYIGTPHHLHRDHAILAAEAGKHIVIEKPLGLTLAECDEVIAAVERNNIHLIVGHTHAFDPAVRVMRRLIASGEVGALGLIAMWNYTNFLYRPRRPEDLDTSRGGGIIFNQVPHQIDTVRLLAGGIVKSVRASVAVLDRGRPTEGLSAALLQLEHGASASIVYSGYDHFDSDEFHYWISEAGTPKKPGQYGQARRSLVARSDDETTLRVKSLSYGSSAFEPRAHEPHFGVMLVTCAGGDLRASPNGVTIYDHQGAREVPIPPRGGVPGRREVLDDMYAAVRDDKRPLHDARWGKATLEVSLAVLQSARENREIALVHQVAVPPGA
jgi:phthalate 4,5-cis-dihydrodiol dehydrogenase